MKASLQITSGGEAGRRIHLRDGHVAQFGRTDWADFAFRDDAAMAEVHFAVECRGDGCFLKALVNDRDTLVNDEKATEIALHTGDKITAGLTTFVVTIEGEAAPEKKSAEADPAAAEKKPPATDFVGVCKFLTLDDALPDAQSDPAQSRDAFLSKLVVAKKFSSAARLYAHWLPKRAAVWWGCLCVDEACGKSLPAEQQAAWNAAKQWVEKQDELSRRAAETAFTTANFAGPGGMLSCAAFAAGESIGPAGSPPVPPDPRMTGHCVKTALVYASVFGDSRLAATRWPAFLVLAQDVLTGKITLPEAK